MPEVVFRLTAEDIDVPPNDKEGARAFEAFTVHAINRRPLSAGTEKLGIVKELVIFPVVVCPLLCACGWAINSIPDRRTQITRLEIFILIDMKNGSNKWLSKLYSTKITCGETLQLLDSKIQNYTVNIVYCKTIRSVHQKRSDIFRQ